MWRNDDGVVEVRFRVSALFRVVRREIVDFNNAVGDIDFVAGQTDHAFHYLFGPRLLRFKNDHVPAFGAVEQKPGLAVERYSPETDCSEAVNEHAMTLEKCGLHAGAVYSVSNGDITHEDDDQSSNNDHLSDVSRLFPKLVRHNVSNCIAVDASDTSDRFACSLTKT